MTSEEEAFFNGFHQGMAKGRLEEREACAKVCDARAESAEIDWIATDSAEALYEYREAEECAQAIRNRETP